MFAYQKERMFNVCCRASSKNDVRLPHGLQKSAAQIETTLQVVDSIAVGLECRLIAKLTWPDVGIAGMNHVPANAGFADSSACKSPMLVACCRRCNFLNCSW